MRFRPALALAVVAVALVVAGLVALGLWQLARNGYKSRLEEQLAARLAQPPLTAEAAAGLPPGELEFRRASATGRWDHERTTTVANRIRFGVRGEDVVTPLLPAEGPAILVNRGWLPLTLRETVLAELAREPAGSVEGLILDASGGTARRTPSGAWTRFDVAAIAATLPYEVAPWGLVEGELLAELPLTPPAELPARGFTAYENAVPHMQYALTWFALAGVLVVTAAIRLGALGRHDARAGRPDAGA